MAPPRRLNQIVPPCVRGGMKDLTTYRAPRYDLPVGPRKDQSFGSARAIKLAVITGAAVLCTIVAFLVITSLLSTPGAGTQKSNLPRFGNLNEMSPIRQSGNNPSANEREGGENQRQAAQNNKSANDNNSQSSESKDQAERERLMEDLRAQQKAQEEREKILQEQRDAIPSPIGEQPPEPADLSR